MKSIPEFNIPNQGKKYLEYNKENLIRYASKFSKLSIISLKDYLQSGPYLAFKHFDSELKKDSKNLDDLPLSKFFNFKTLYKTQYRIRISEKQKLENPSDMFHIPFQLRKIVKSYRYSISGIPSIYSSNSIYIACQEVGIKDFKNVYGSKLETTSNFSTTTLDFRYKLKMYNDIDRFKFLVRWPMIYACSLKAKEQSCSFVPEYILPQMIYQWIRTNATINKNGKIIGVIYNSSKLPSYSDQDLTYGYNFAGAIQHSSEKGYCALLRQVFKVSNPIELNIIEEKYKKLVDLVGVNSLKWIYEDNEKTDYSETVYSKIEHYFHQKKMYVI